MDTSLLITGGAGFIGSNLVHHALEHTADRLVVVDKLTYAGSLLNLERALTNPRVTFVEADIADRAAMTRAFAEHRPRAVLNLAAETHVDRSIDGPTPFFDTNIVGTFVLLEAARAFVSGLSAADRRGSAFSTSRPTRSTARSAQDGSVQRGHAVRAQFAVRGEQGGGRSSRPRLPPHLRPADAHHELLEQLRAVSVSGEADSADDAERARGPAAADLRRRRQRPRLAARRGSLRGPAARAGRRARRAKSTISAAATSGRTCRSSIGSASRSTRLQPAASNPALRGASSYRALKTFVPDRPGHDRRYAIDATKIARELGWRPRARFRERASRDRAVVSRASGLVRAVQAGRYNRERLGALELKPCSLTPDS